ASALAHPTATPTSGSADPPLRGGEGNITHLAKPKHTHRHRTADAVGAEEADQVVHARDRNAVEGYDEVLAEQSGRRGRAARLDRGQHGAGGVGDAGGEGVPARDGHGLRADADEGAANAAVPDQFADDEADRVARDGEADALRTWDHGGVDAD